MKLSHLVVLLGVVAFCSADDVPAAAASEQLPPILVVPNGNSHLEPVLGNQASDSPAAPLPSHQPSEEKPPLLGRPDGHEPGSKDLIGRPDGHDGGSQPLIGRPDGHDGGSQPLIGRPDGHDGGSQPLIGRPDGHEYNSEMNDAEEYSDDADDSFLNPARFRNLGEGEDEGEDYSEYLGGEEEAIYNDGEDDKTESEEEKPLVRCKRPMCRMYCANGFQTDSTGCPVCACLQDPCQGVQCGAGERCIVHECAEGTACTNLTSECVQRDADEYPDSSSEERWEPLPRTNPDGQPCATPMCADFCADGYAYDSRGCMTCDCSTGPSAARVSPLCPAVDCLEDCPNGFQRDQHGCQTCDCNAPLAPAARVEDAATPLECATPMCAVRCVNGYRNNAHGCMTCDCNEEPQGSFESKKAPVMCATPMCANWCPNGYAYNAQGCMTCDCAGVDVPPRPLASYPTEQGGAECPLMKCGTRCVSGYRFDANGCRTCECDDNGALPTCGAGVCEVGQICRNKTIKFIATPVCIAKPLCYVARERLGLSPGQSTSSSRGVSGTFAPECEASGAFKPLQCDAPRGDCWCVDDRGEEIADSRTAYFVEEHKPKCERNITVALNMRMVLVRTLAFSAEDDNIDEQELTRVLAEQVAEWMLIEPQYLTVLSVNHEDDRVAAKLLARYDSRADLPSASAHLQRWIHLDRCHVFLERAGGITLRVDPDTFEVEHKFSLTPAPVRPPFPDVENGVYEERVSWWPSCLTDNYYILFGLFVIGGVFILCIIFLVVIHARRRRARNRLDFEHARLTSQCSVSSEKSLLSAGDGSLRRGGEDDGVLLISAGRVSEKEALA